jgi:NADH:ubiquinone oxidoreductase subunit 2 (subunit N)
MTLAALLAVGAAGAIGSGWALGRGGAASRLGAIGGMLALVLVAILAAVSPTPATLTPDASGAVAGTLWNGALVPGAYLRVVIVLWSASSVVVAGVAWLLRGTDGLRGLLPATLAALVGTAVTLAASSPVLGIVAAGATGLASVPVVLASPRAAAAAIAAREVRVAVATALVVLAVASVAHVLEGLIFANPDGPASSPGSGTAAAIAFGLLAIALVVAVRVGAIPYHVRVSALTDLVAPGSLPLVAAWLPLPLAVVAVGVVAGVLAPLKPPVGSAQALIVAATLLATLAAALVAFIQDDLRHAVGYLTIADLGFVILAIASLDPLLWGPARTWLLMVAVSKTALAVWAAVVESRFETRSVPELRGWLRPSPLLGGALLLIVLATYGLPGWAVMNARVALAGHGAGGPWDAALLVASLLTLPAYVRWLWLGIGAATSHVDRATPELAGMGRLPTRRLALTPPARGRNAGLPVEQEHSETPAPVTPGWLAAPAAGAPDRGTRSEPATRTTTPAQEPETEPTTTPVLDVRPGTGVGARGRTARTGRGTTSAMTAGAAPTAAAQLALPEATPAADEPLVGTPRRALRATSGADAAAQAAETIKRHRTGLLSGAVLALALLASLVAFGAFDVASAACEPVPGISACS